MNKLITLVLCLISNVALAVDYPVAFLAHPRTTGFFLTQSVSERKGQYVHHVGTDLVIMEPDGTERVLVAGNQAELGLRAVHDFCISLDGKSIVYSHVRTIAGAIGVWCDLYRVDIATGQTTQLTDSLTEWNPPRGSAQWATSVPSKPNSDSATKGIQFDTVWNIGPCVCGDGSIVFCSNRNAMRAPSEGKQPAFQLFRMAADGKYCHLIGHMNLSGGLHPTITRSGRIDWSSSEQQGGRTGLGNGWAIWSMNPDASDWGSEISAIGEKNPAHFQTETSDGSLVSAEYYDTRVYGNLRVSPPFHSDPFGPPTKFGHPLIHSNIGIKEGYWGANVGRRYSYMRRGFYTPMPWTTSRDAENRNVEGTEKPGIVSHPAAIPNNGIFLTWTGDEGDALTDLGVYMIQDITQPVLHHSGLIPVIDKDDRHEWMARPVVPFLAIYGLESPPVPEGDVDPNLPAGSPFGTVSTSSMSWPEIVHPQFGNTQSFRNFLLQDAQYIRILSFNKSTTNDSYMFSKSATAVTSIANSEGFSSAFNERCGSYGEVPLYKYRTAEGGVHYGPDPPDGSISILDPEGKPDTSFELQIPANHPWTFQVLNAKKEAVGTAQTWHQVIPGEYRTCGGCHTHHGRVPFSFDQSFAASEEYEVQRLENIRIAVWGRDIKPIVDKYTLPIVQHGWKAGIPFYRSSETTVDDDTRLTREEAETIRLWIDTGMMSEGVLFDYKRQTPTATRSVVEADKLGPYADTQAPTISHAIFPDRIVIGLFDPQAGIDLSSFSVTATVPLAGTAAGTELAQQFSHNSAEHIWTLTTQVPDSGDLSISVRDKQVGTNLYGEPVGPGNLTAITIPIIHRVDDPDEPDDPIDPNAEEIARLQAEILVIEEQITELESQREVLQAEIDALLSN